MFSDAKEIEQATKDFAYMHQFAPFRFGGVWWVAQVQEYSENGPNGFRAYRTKKAAVHNTTVGTVWRMTF